MTAVQTDHPGCRVRVWAEDEHRLGLKPVLRRVWVRRGSRPSVLVRPRYQWLYVVSFIEPATGESFWLLLPTVSTASLTQALAAFATHVGAGPEQPVVLVLDRAGWHASRKVVVPPGLTLVFLPACSPALQPAERLWSPVDEAVANRVWERLDDLTDALATRCRQLRTMPEVLRARTCFHWWPQPATTSAQ